MSLVRWISKNQEDFFGKLWSRNFGAPGCHPSTLIGPAITALASKDSVETICKISEGYRSLRGVTGPMNFKNREVLFGKLCSRVFGAPGCHPSTLIGLAITALASKVSVETIYKISEGYRSHRGVTGPMNFKKREVFFGKLWSRNFVAPGCHPSTLIGPAITALASKDSVETICKISEGYRSLRGVTGPMNFEKSGGFFRKIVGPDFWGPWLPSKHLYWPCNPCTG